MQKLFYSMQKNYSIFTIRSFAIVSYTVAALKSSYKAVICSCLCLHKRLYVGKYVTSVSTRVVLVSCLLQTQLQNHFIQQIP